MSLDAFLSTNFEYTRQLPSIWDGHGVESQHLNREIFEAIIDDFRMINDPDINVLGEVVVGPPGSGKTHLIGSLRAHIMKKGDFFILLELAGVKDFWLTAALGFVNSVHQKTASGKPQFQLCLGQIIAHGGDHFDTFRAMLAELKGNPTSINQERRKALVQHFVGGMLRAYGSAALHHQGVIRAYLYQLYGDDTLKLDAYYWLMGMELDENIAKTMGLPAKQEDPHMIVKGTMWLLSRVGRVLIAVDQIDAIVAQHNILSSSTDEIGRAAVNEILQGMAMGLMALYDTPGRSMTVISCLPETWDVIIQQTVHTVTDRFREQRVLRPIRAEERAKLIVQERLQKAYDKHGFTPPYPTYPFKPESFASSAGMYPRKLLQICEQHRTKCRADKAVNSLNSFVSKSKRGTEGASEPNSLDHIYRKSIADSNASALLDPNTEEELSELVVGGLLLCANQLSEDHEHIDYEVQHDRKLDNPPLTARLKAIFRQESDREIHVCFRVLQHTNANAFQSRLRTAMTASGLQRELPFRHLFILRTPDIPGGPKTQQLAKSAQNSGARFIPPKPKDIEMLAALVAMKHYDGFHEWLRASGYLQQIDILTEAMRLVLPEGKASREIPKTSQGIPDGETAESSDKVVIRDTNEEEKTETPFVLDKKTTNRVKVDPAMIPIGQRLEGGQTGSLQQLPVSLLPRHIAILAGSGSGKTVLIRRIIEESVLRGIPAVVLDPNNDLSLLGDAWPEAPSSWGQDDASLAKHYHEMADVVVWTPGTSKGRPIMLEAMPDFTYLDEGDDRDEFERAVALAMTTITSFIKITETQQGILADAIRTFARRKLTGIGMLARFMQDLPVGVSLQSNAEKDALKVGDKILAAISTNPLLKAHGEPLDPSVLFESTHKKRVRVSVINFAGLTSDEAKRDFVHRLQMAIFTYVKASPSPTGRLYVVDEAHLFMGRGPQMTASRASGSSLVAQARKYGLGVVVATQNPKDIQHTIISSCTTHLYGKMNSPATIGAIRELVSSKGGNAKDIAALKRGIFYFSSENQPQPVRIQAAMCLSHHPINPPSGDEVIQRAGEQHP